MDEQVQKMTREAFWWNQVAIIVGGGNVGGGIIGVISYDYPLTRLMAVFGLISGIVGICYGIMNLYRIVNDDL